MCSHIVHFNVVVYVQHNRMYLNPNLLRMQIRSGFDRLAVIFESQKIVLS